MSLESLKKDLEFHLKTSEKSENSFEEFKQETMKVASKYLDGFNNILEGQSETRANNRLINDELIKLKERVLLIETYINNLTKEDTLDVIRKTQDFLEDYKEIECDKFRSVIETKVKFLIAAAYFFATTLVSLFIFTIIDKFMKG